MPKTEAETEMKRAESKDKDDYDDDERVPGGGSYRKHKLAMARCSLFFAAIWLATLSNASTSSTSPSKTPTKTPKPSSSSKCFYPNGKPEQNFSYNYQPCGGQNTTWSQCCIPGQDICTPNGLCTHLTNAVGAYDYRGGCTNADWSGCPQVCLDDDRDEYFWWDYRGSNPTQTDTGTDKKTDGGTDKSNNSVKIGAAVGGSLGGIAVIGAVIGVWLVLRKKKQQQKMRGVEKDGQEVSNHGTVESLGMKQAYVPGSETAYTPLAEVEGQPAVMEMDSRGVHELG
ncbi:hypothetical protein TrVFT333_008119 [Trichoderma virens FT-333]|nr:hypothetical protein TrVFT333_008119 [Trichoderma virens FT-333]